MERIDQKKRDLELALDPYPEIAFLPANTQKLVPMTGERRREFSARLTAIADEIENATGDETRRADVESADTPDGRPPHELAGHACATCRGQCCRAGGNRAYLTPATFRRVLAQDPDLTLEDLQRAYLSRIPRESYEGSCIFHGRTGCKLPRDMRSNTCNDFLCADLRSLSADPGEQRLAAAFDALRLVRLAVIGGDNHSLLFEDE